MAVPKYDEMMLPVLKRLGDERDFEPLTSKQIREHVALHFALGEDERAEQIPSGFARYANNAQWACTYLKQAGLIASPKRGSFRIRSEGALCWRRASGRSTGRCSSAIPSSGSS